MENKHTIGDLYQMQALPLSIKVRMTETRIRGWVNEYGEDGVYVAFSGGKDSTVLLDIARNIYPNLKAMFVDVPTQYIELREFAQTFDNVDIVKPKISFMQVCEKYGFPLISKETAECVNGAKKYLTSIRSEVESLQNRTEQNRTEQNRPYAQFYRKVCGLEEYAKSDRGGYDRKYRRIKGIGEFTKPKTTSQNGWEQSTSGENAGLVHEEQDDSGEYP